jgi:hypothetical protein
VKKKEKSLGSSKSFFLCFKWDTIIMLEPFNHEPKAIILKHKILACNTPSHIGRTCFYLGSIKNIMILFEVPIKVTHCKKKTIELSDAHTTNLYGL